MSARVLITTSEDGETTIVDYGFHTIVMHRYLPFGEPNDLMLRLGEEMHVTCTSSGGTTIETTISDEFMEAMFHLFGAAVEEKRPGRRKQLISEIEGDEVAIQEAGQ